MRASRLFRLVWRINALVILVAGVLASAVATLALTFLWREQTQTREVRGVVNIAGAEVQQEKFRLGRFEPLRSVGLLRASLTSEQEYDQAAFSKSASAIRNYLFFDPTTRESRWLLPSNGQVFLLDVDLFYPSRSPHEDDDERRCLGTLLILVGSDSNGDDRLNEQDAKSVAITAADGTEYRVVAEQIDDYHGQYVRSEDEVIVFFTQRATMTSASIDLRTLSLRWSEPLRPKEAK